MRGGWDTALMEPSPAGAGWGRGGVRGQAPGRAVAGRGGRPVPGRSS
ncbi:hypothetical protein ATKI12_4192 [Kitasatospora sp. Ki12]